MKRLTILLLLTALLCGCGNELPAETTLPAQETQITIPTEPAGLYVPGSDRETLTGGAIRVYVPEDPSSYAIGIIGSDVLLFSGESNTTLTRLTGDNLYPIAQIQLDCLVYPEDTSFQISDKGITFYDAGSGAVVFLDNDLKEANRIAVPETIVGSPVLSSNRLKLYYCTADAIRVLDLETGLDRLLKQISYSYQSVEGILFHDTVLQCCIADEESYTIFLSTETGELLAEPCEHLNLSGEEDNYYTVLSGGVMPELVYGTRGESPRMLIPGDIFGSSWYLERAHAVATYSGRDTAAQFDVYDLSSGLRTASLEIVGDYLPWYIEMDTAGEAVYLIGFDAELDRPAIYRWDMTRTAVAEETVYAGPWYTLEQPDTDGLTACAEIAAEIGSRYGLSIQVGMDAVAVEPWDYDMEPEYQVPVIQNELERLDALLAVYPEGFFETIDEDIRICLVRSLQGSAESGSLDTANGIQFWDAGSAYVAVSCGESLEMTLFHELFHVIDNHVLSACNAYYDWERLNPAGFVYDLDYVANQNRDPEQYLEDETRAFIDTYSMSYPKEDRARIMEYASTAGNDHYFQSEIMQRKLRTLCEGIREAFDLREYPNALIWEQYLQEPLV